MGELVKVEISDLAGAGKFASAIPKEVYEQSATTLLTTFQKLTAPFTETSSGLGRYIRQKFDNMVEAEKAVATFALQRALHRAEQKCVRAGVQLRVPQHPKSFVAAIEEASKETEPTLHEMWVNLLASQLSEDLCQPSFVQIIQQLTPAEARILVQIAKEYSADEAIMSDANQAGGEVILKPQGIAEQWQHFCAACGASNPVLAEAFYDNLTRLGVIAERIASTHATHPLLSAERSCVAHDLALTRYGDLFLDVCVRGA
jgi:hypothetical protein